jgi:hypothetical protein
MVRYGVEWRPTRRKIKGDLDNDQTTPAATRLSTGKLYRGLGGKLPTLAKVATEPLESTRLNLRRLHVLVLRLSDDFASRIDAFSRYFLGRPYKSNPLKGSPASPEIFTVSLSAFDCVTYVETVLALARVAKLSEFREELRKIRYERGRVQWCSRNHYMTQWIQNNIQNRVIEPVPMPNVPLIVRERLLNTVPGLPPRRTCVKCVPKAAISRLEPHLQSGDLIFFASTRKNLDIFHVGIIVRGQNSINLRHASRSQGKVVEQTLSEFLKANRMAGVIVVRPRSSQPIARATRASGGKHRPTSHRNRQAFCQQALRCTPG